MVEMSDEEFYTYDKPPRANVRGLASVDEKTYTPNTDIKMGDHPSSGATNTRGRGTFTSSWAIVRSISTTKRLRSSLKTPFSGPQARKSGQNDPLYNTGTENVPSSLRCGYYLRGSFRFRHTRR